MLKLNYDSIKKYQVQEKNVGKRIDKYLAAKNSDCSRSYLQKLFRNGQVTVNGKEVKKSYRVDLNDRISLYIPSPSEPDIEAVKVDFNIIYEDDSIIVVNKPAGLIVHPVPDNKKYTLVNGLLAYTDDLSGIGGVKRPGIVHRLDKDTSGVIVVAKEDKSHKKLVEQFKNRKIKKTYRAIVKGHLPHKSGKIDAPIGRDQNNRTRMTVTDKNSKKAISTFELLKDYENYSYIEVGLETGRTHQIRVHFSYLGNPILGDKKYGKKDDSTQIKRQLLHAYKIGFFHPENEHWVIFTAPIPEDFKQLLDSREV